MSGNYPGAPGDLQYKDGRAFTTPRLADTVPPKILTGPVALAITDASARIEWTTDEDADARVVYQKTVMEEGDEPYDTLDEAFAAAEAANKTMTWILRAVGVFVLFIGFAAIFKPLSVLADVIPFIGNLVEKGTGLISFGLALMLGLLTIAVGWIFYRPLLGIGLLVAVIVVAVLLFRRGKKGKPAATGTAAPPPPPPPPPPAGS